MVSRPGAVANTVDLVPDSDETRPHLDPIEARILGSLLEKQRTVPASYPLTMNALRAACNQTSSRDPVSDYDENSLHAAVSGLRDRELIRTVWTGSGARTVKFHQRLQERLELPAELEEAGIALLTVLLLRGPQAPGELRTRTERLHQFADRTEVEQLLRRLAELPSPLVVELERRAGQQDRRWASLLGAPPPPPTATTATNLEVVLAEGAEARDAAVVAAYDAGAAGMPEDLDLAGMPLDQWLLGRIADLGGPVIDVGCGSGRVAAELAAAGADVSGLDLSPGMIDRARADHPELHFEVGDLRQLLRPRTASGWAAITGWYALVHLAPSELPAAITALARVLDPGGTLALAVYLGDQVRPVTDLSGVPVELGEVLHRREDVLQAVDRAGLVDVEWYQRGPYPGEDPVERLYVLARKPGPDRA